MTSALIRLVDTTATRRSLIVALAVMLMPPLMYAQAPYWHTAGTVTHVLQNNAFDLSQVINEVDLMTNQNTRIRLFANGQFEIFPPSGTIIGTNHQMQFATMQVQGGDASGLASYTAQSHDWGQNIQSFVTRANTVSYVVSWNGTDRFYVAGQGWIYANGAYYGSDRSRKTDIKPISRALDSVMKLDGITFHWKDEKLCEKCPEATSTKLDNRTEMGLIAQDVEKVVPEVVRTAADGTKALAYQNLVALLIESIKTQQRQLQDQATAIKVLQDNVKKLQISKSR